MLRRLADVIVRSPQLPWKDHGDWERFQNTGRKQTSVPSLFFLHKKEDAQNCRPDNLTSVLGKVLEITLMESISMYVKDKKVIVSSQHGFTKKGEKLFN